MLGGCTERTDREDLIIAEQIGVIAVPSAFRTVLAPAANHVGLHVWY